MNVLARIGTAVGSAMSFHSLRAYKPPEEQQPGPHSLGPWAMLGKFLPPGEESQLHSREWLNPRNTPPRIDVIR